MTKRRPTASAICPLAAETEINNHRVRVAGIVRGARSFIQSPYIFTSYKNALSAFLCRTRETPSTCW